MNGMEYIRRSYGVQARRGGRIKYMGKKTGTILSSRYGRLRVRFDGEKKTSILHPGWLIEYLSADHEPEEVSA